MRSIFFIIFILSAITPIFSGSKYPVILPEIADSIITYTYKGEYKKHESMQSGDYSKQLYRSFKRNIESISELYCLINDSLDLQFRKESSDKNTILIPTSGFEKTGAELIIFFQHVHITLNSKYSSHLGTTLLIQGPGMGAPMTHMSTGGRSGFSSSIKLSTVISVFSIQENRLLFTKKITSTKSSGDDDPYSKTRDFSLTKPTDDEIEKRGNVGGNEIEEAIQDVSRKLIKNTEWEVKNKHPQNEIVE